MLLAFDVDWTQVTPEQQQWIDEWVSSEGGGIAFIAGDAYTYLLSAEDERWNKIRTLCPVIIDDSAMGTTLRDSARQAFQIELTQDGQPRSSSSCRMTLLRNRSGQSSAGSFGPRPRAADAAA